MNYNYVTSRGKAALDDTTSAIGAIVIILFVVAVIAGLAALGFWLFTWAVATLFAYHIAFTWINFWAYFVLSWIFGRGSSSSDSKKSSNSKK
jgi:hypothetical protein